MEKGKKYHLEILDLGRREMVYGNIKGYEDQEY